MKIGAKKDLESSWDSLGRSYKGGETQPNSNLSSKFHLVYIQTQGLFVSHLLCTHNNPKSFLLSFLFLADRHKQPLGFLGRFWLIQINCFLVSCKTFYSLLVCVYKNEVISYFRYYQEIE